MKSQLWVVTINGFATRRFLPYAKTEKEAVRLWQENDGQNILPRALRAIPRDVERVTTALVLARDLVVMCVGAWLGYPTQFLPPRPPADSGSAQNEGSAPLDGGPYNAHGEARACDCCFTTANEIRCTVGVAPLDAGVLTVPRCRGGK